MHWIIDILLWALPIVVATIVVVWGGRRPAARAPGRERTVLAVDLSDRVKPQDDRDAADAAASHDR